MSVLNNHENVKATLSNYLQSQMLWSVKRKKKCKKVNKERQKTETAIKDKKREIKKRKIKK